MKHLFLGAALVIAPLAVAVPALLASSHTSTATGNLGDLSTMHQIVEDTLALANSGNLPSAEKRITDFETAWDAAAPTLRKKDTATWTMIDHLADAAIGALRDSPPSTDTVVPAVEKLAAVLVGPSASVSNTTVVAFSTRNADGSPVPCEVALEEVRKVSAIARFPPATRQKSWHCKTRASNAAMPMTTSARTISLPRPSRQCAIDHDRSNISSDRCISDLVIP